MGNARWNNEDWDRHSKSTQTQSRAQIFGRSEIHPDLNPINIQYRESVDSESNPESTPIILAVDETGSMGKLAEQLVKNDLGTIMKEIYDRRPVTDPHIMCMGIGDAFSDRAPLQVTQFEASVAPLVKQTSEIYLEANGGSNGGESYSLAWWFATYKVETDAWKKRGKKGYIFTIGDECPHKEITAKQIRDFMGVGCESKIPTEELLALTLEYWHVFHLIVKPYAAQPVVATWKELLGEAAIEVKDTNYLAEGIISIIQVLEGHDLSSVVSSWNNKQTALVVNSAIRNLSKNKNNYI